jgi:DNA-binding NtrC family response regulator
MNDGRFPVVLMDIKMPGMDGVTAFRHIKARFPDVRVVLMTAYSSPDLLREAEREGAFRVVSKPVDLNALMPLLQRALRSARPVLVVDDDLAFQRTLTELLQLRGFRVVPVGQSHSIQGSMQTHAPAAVVLHLRLGKQIAREAIDAIRGGADAIPLLIYSGHADSVTEARRILPTEWIAAYMEKPVAVDRLSDLLDGVLAAAAD